MSLIDFSGIEKSDPYSLFQSFFEKALLFGQKNPDAICISTYDEKTKEISSRYVNLKYIKKNRWYFFSNYTSDKAKDIMRNNQVSLVLFWPEIFTQVRLKAKIFKASEAESDKHFQSRSMEKNALAISSNQSNRIEAFDIVKKNFEHTKNIIQKKEHYDRPKYWGGYYFIPYYFEFWEGHQNRINKRTVFRNIEDSWEKYFLEP